MFWRLLFSGLLFLGLLLPGVLFSASASASVHQYEGLSAGVLFRSQQSLRDRAGYAWQVVFFREFQPGQTVTAKLRLVGFPDIIEFDHPQPMEVITSAGETFTVPDLFATEAPAPNVGQYDLAGLPIPTGSGAYLKLLIPLKGQTISVLRIPAYVLQEWQQMPTTVAPTLSRDGELATR